MASSRLVGGVDMVVYLSSYQQCYQCGQLVLSVALRHCLTHFPETLNDVEEGEC